MLHSRRIFRGHSTTYSYSNLSYLKLFLWKLRPETKKVVVLTLCTSVSNVSSEPFAIFVLQQICILNMQILAIIVIY